MPELDEISLAAKNFSKVKYFQLFKNYVVCFYGDHVLKRFLIHILRYIVTLCPLIEKLNPKLSLKKNR